MYFTVLNNENKEEKLKIIHTFSNGEIHYIIYSDINDEIYASRYHINNNQYILEEISDEKEWDMIDKVLATLEVNDE